MKTLAFFCILLLTASFVAADDASGSCYVIIDHETYFCDDIRPGKATTRIFRNGKLFMKIPTLLVNAYQKDGKLFERMPVVNKNQDTAGWAFMQFITSREGYRLYRFCSNCLHYDPATGQIAPENPVYRYYVFKNGKFISISDDYNDIALLKQFSVKRLS